MSHPGVMITELDEESVPLSATDIAVIVVDVPAAPVTRKTALGTLRRFILGIATLGTVAIPEAVVVDGTVTAAGFVGNASTASAWATSRLLTIGASAKSLDGSANVSWSLGEIGAAAAAHAHGWAEITGKPTTLAGYGITDAVPAARTLQIANGTGITGGGSAVDLSANRSWTLGLTGQALALHNLATTGFVARTAAATVAARTITGTTNQVIVTNGDGVAGNPTLALPQNIHTAASPTFAAVTAATFTGALAGNASSATVATTLQTARTINGTSFDGSANITTATWGTTRTLTVGATGKSVNGSGNVSWSLTEIGATTVGGNLFGLTNPSAVRFLRVNADNTVSALDAATFRSAIGAGTSSTVGTVTSVGGTGTVDGLTLSGTVTTSGNLTLGGSIAIAGSQVTSGTVADARLSANVPLLNAAADFTNTLRHLGYVPTDLDTHSTSAARQVAAFATGFQPLNRPAVGNYFSGFSFRHNLGGTYVTQVSFAASDSSPFAYRYFNNVSWSAWRVVLSDQNYNSYAPTLTGTGASGTWAISVTGSAATLTTTRTFSATGDATAPAQNFNGSANVALPLTLATVNASVGSFGSSSSVAQFTVNAKGLVTAAASVAIGGLNASVISAGTMPLARGGTNASSYSTTGSGTRVLVYDIGSGAFAAQPAGVAGQFLQSAGAAGDVLWASVPMPAAFTSSTSGVVPASGGNAAHFLSADGTWKTPAYPSTLSASAITGGTFPDASYVFTDTVTAVALLVRETPTNDGIVLQGRAGGVASYRVTIQPGTLTAHRTLTLANGNTTLVAGTMVDTGRNLTVAGASGRITSSASAQSLAADRTWTLDLAASGVAAGSYGSASQVATLTVDTYGRLTAAASTSIAISASQITSGSINIARIPWANTSSEPFGTYVGIGSGSDTVVGSGESRASYEAFYAVGGRDNETLWLLSDQTVNIRVGMQSGWAAGTTALNITNAGVATFSSTVNATTFVGALNGNATTATTAAFAVALQTPRTLWGNSFDGTANTSGPLSLVDNGSDVGRVGATAWHEAAYLASNVYYAGSGEAYSATNWRYIRSAGSNNSAGALLSLKGNATEAGVQLSLFSYPTSTGANATPASMTLRWRVDGTGAMTVGLVNGQTISSAASFTGSVTAVSFAGNGASLTNLNAANIATGTLPILRGGTNTTSYSTTGTGTRVLLYDSATGRFEAMVAGASGQFLQSSGTTGDVLWASVPAPAIFTSSTAGIVPASGGGTANFLRADGTWAAPPGTTTLPASSITQGTFPGASYAFADTVAAVGLTIRPATQTQDGIILQGRAGGTLSRRVTIQPPVLTASRTLTLADGDTTLVAGTMVPTTGTGASGTWGISITGNAATATTATNISAYSINQNLSTTSSPTFATVTAPTVISSSIGTTTAVDVTLSRNNVAIVSLVANGLEVDGKSLGVGSASANATAGRVDASNDIVAYSSDRRLKTAVLPIVDPMDDLMTLVPITYQWNALAHRVARYRTDERLIGLFAQDVQRIRPEAVKLAPFDNDGQNRSRSGQAFLTVQYEKLVPLVIAGQQQMWRLLTATGDRMNALDRRISTLERELATLTERRRAAA